MQLSPPRGISLPSYVFATRKRSGPFGFVRVRGRARAQPQERRPRHSRATRWSCSPACPAPANRRWPSARSTPRRSGGISNRSPLRPASVPSDGRAGRRRDRRPAAGRRAAAAARLAHHALVGRQRHDALESAAHAVFARRRLSARPAASLRRVVLAQHARGRLSPVPRAGPHLRGHRALDGPGRLADHPRARHRRLAARLAGAEPARHPRHARLRRRPSVARAAQEGSRLDPLHRRAADVVPVYAGYTPDEVRRALKRKEEPSYMGTFTGARRYVLHTFANTQSAR